MNMPPPSTADWLCHFLHLGIAPEPEEAITTRHVSSFQPLTLSSFSLNWPDLLHLARRHGVALLLYHRLKTARFQAVVPEHTFHTLHQSYLKNAARNMRLYHELAQVLTLLNEHNIPVIVLKGAYLAEAVYGNIALRTMCDIDLLVQKSDLAGSQQILLEHRYLRKNGRVPIDMHWNLDLSIANLPIDMNEVWERATSDVVAGVNVCILSPEDLLLHLCTHIAFHHDFQEAGLRTLCDIQATIHHYSGTIHWEHVTERATTWQACHAAYGTFAVAEEMLAVGVPGDVLETLKPVPMDPQIYSWIQHQIFQGASDSIRVSPFFWKLWTPGSCNDKIAALRRLVFPPTEFLWQKYPGASVGYFKRIMTYMIRLNEHLLLYSGIVWKILSGNRHVRLQIQQQRKLNTIRQWLRAK